VPDDTLSGNGCKEIRRQETGDRSIGVLEYWSTGVLEEAVRAYRNYELLWVPGLADTPVS
jgi:hypothetical protein